MSKYFVCLNHYFYKAEQLNEADPNFKHHRTGDHMRYGTGYWTGRRRYNRTGNWTGTRHSRTRTTSASPTSTSRS